MLYLYILLVYGAVTICFEKWWCSSTGGALCWCCHISPCTWWRHIGICNIDSNLSESVSMWATSSRTLLSSQACRVITWLSIMMSCVWCHGSIVGTTSYGICHNCFTILKYQQNISLEFPSYSFCQPITFTELICSLLSSNIMLPI